MAPHLYRELLVAGREGPARDGPQRRPGADRRARAARACEKPDGRGPSLRPGPVPPRDVLREPPLPAASRARRRGARLRQRRATSRSSSGSRGSASATTRTRRSSRRASATSGRDAIDDRRTSSALPRALDKIAARTGLIPPRAAGLPHRVRLRDAARPTRSAASRWSSRPSTSTRATTSPGSTRGSSRTRSSSSTTCRRATSSRATSRPYWFTYQSGLFTGAARGRAAKPGGERVQVPARGQRRRGDKARIWGQVRFAPNGATYPIALQERAPGSSTLGPLRRPGPGDAQPGVLPGAPPNAARLERGARCGSSRTSRASRSRAKLSRR